MNIVKLNTPFDYIATLRERPAIFWGNRRSLSYIYFYIQGFLMGRAGTDLGIDKMTADFTAKNGFQSFVANKFNITNNAQPWYSIIEFETNSQDEAFDVFYELLNEFFDNQKS
ncbi:MAG: hypothetical protein FWB91_06505 [Defluviitaleaceae bacterium]|nr:hypothetical protein [Defluviitaleaceae bacterium]